MELNTIEETKTKIIVELIGDTHTLPNMLKKELWNDKHVKAAGYRIDHPLTGTPNIMVETDGADPKKTINASIKRLKKAADDFKKAGKIVKE